jgi:hypothetical protein
LWEAADIELLAAISKVANMNIKQKILVGVLIVAVCGGLGVAVSTLSTPGGDVKPKPTPQLPTPLIFPDTPKPRTQEAYTPGHYAFHFKSLADTPTTVGVNRKNCKCASVDICLAPEEWSTDEAALAGKAEDPGLQWTPLEKDGDGFTIPPGADGWIRVGWKDDKAGDQRFAAEMWVFEQGSGVVVTMEVGVSFIDPVSICWEEEQQKTDASVGKLSPGEQRETHFLLWSCTREKFTLTQLQPKDDPCISIGPMTPLSAEELKYLSMEPRKNKALFGYRVAVTVKERDGERQLDIGPFRRGIAWKADDIAEPVRASVGGNVLGEISASVAGSPEYPRLDMGSIDPANPTVHEIHLESANPQVELTVDEKSCDLVKVELVEGSKGKDVTLNDGSTRRKWTVKVSFRPESGFRGPFPSWERPGYTPADCMVAFKITHAGAKDERPRRVRIPISGQVRN